MANKIEHLCEVCGKDCEELFTYKGYEHSSSVVWMCDDCFVDEHGRSYEDKK